MTLDAVWSSIASGERDAQPPRILVIDDDAVNLELLRVQLGAERWAVACAASGRAGLDSAFANPPDLVISDVIMPDLDGYAVVRSLKAAEQLRRVPVLLVTSANEREERIHGLAAGADDFLSRPIDAPELLARVRSLLRTKCLNDELQSLNRELEQRVALRTAELQATIEELEAFAYSISHDLRAPLRGIDGFTQAVLEDYASSLHPVAVAHLGRVRAASQRMGQMIDDLLKLSRLSREPVRCALVDISAMAEGIAADLQRTQRDRSVAFCITRNVVAYGDPGLLRLLYQNLLENAWKFTRRESSAAIAVGVTEREGTATYFVRDNGVGFDMAYAAKLFGVFQRLHDRNDFEGNGIGLATVQRIVHRHSGQVWAESVPGEGSTFWFTLSGAAEVADRA